MRIVVVSTCNVEGWNKYGSRMFEGFVRFWEKDIELYFVPEGFMLPDAPNVKPFIFPDWFRDWKKSHASNVRAHGCDPMFNRINKRDYDFKQDCVRFSHKIAALTYIAQTQHCDLLIWMDADIITHKPVTKVWLDSLLPDCKYMGWLYRTRTYPECGFMMFRPQLESCKTFMRNLRGIYESNDIFKEQETHDSYIIQQIANDIARPYNLAGIEASRYHSVFDYSPLRERLEHLKGARK